MVIQRDGAAIRSEILGTKPVLAQHDRIGRDLPDVLNEAGEVPGDLRIGRAILSERRGDGLCRTETVDLDHERNDAAARRLPGQHRAEPGGQGEAAERHEAPVVGLDAGGADALVPDLGCLLVGVTGSGVVPYRTLGRRNIRRTFRRG